ncbi:MAG: TonB-dependent receptor [Casimicrobiaceae bacterium]|nr:TonB-dependent receptor [Casimicrobiaceae bacterium]
MKLRSPLGRGAGVPSCTLRSLAVRISLLFAVSPLTHAQSLTTAAVEPVFVTATKRAQPVADVQASVQVITREELASYAGMNVTEALQLAVGVDARPTGANSTVQIRGFSAGAGSPVLVLIDGMRRTAKYGGVNLNLLPLESVERIEIVRGPMSALYGADAAGGVINIITKPVSAAPPGSGSVRLTLGTMEREQRETATAGATLHAATGALRHRLSAEVRRREAFRYDRSTVLADLGRIEEQFLNYAGEWVGSSGMRLGWTLEGTWQRDTAPGLLAASPPTRPQPVPFTAYERETRHYADIRLATPLGPGELTIEASHGHSDGATTRAFPTIEETDYTQSEIRARYAVGLGAHQLILGAGQARDDLAVTILANPRARTTRHAFVQDEWRIGYGLRALVGLRHDDTSDFGSVTTPRLSLAWSEGPFTARVGYGEAFRAPSALELYSRFFRGRFVIVGNPNLRPERNESIEAALAWSTRTASAELVLFDAKVRDLIQTVTKPRLPSDPPSVTLRSEYSNVARARLKGAEFTARARLALGWDAFLGYDYLDAHDALTGARLTNRARANLRASLRYTSGPWQAELRHRQWFDFYAADPALRTAPPFNAGHQLTDVRLAWQVNRSLNLAFGIDNLFDKPQPKNWSSVGGTMEPAGRFFYTTLRYGF